jgi:hypothetical protein
MDSRAEPYDGCMAALPVAAALTLLLAYWLPIRFEYQPNDLGIVSLTTLARYPIQQEMFWFVFALGAGTLLAWLFARVFRRTAATPRAIVAVEALGVVSLLAALWLPPPLAVLTCGAAVGGALWIASRGEAQAREPAAARFPGVPARRGPVSLFLWLAAAVVVALLASPGLWVGLWMVTNGVLDEQLVRHNFGFMGETGQHLAWTNSIRHGGFQGRDFFCLYGPLYDLSIAAFWSLVGRSIAAYELHRVIAVILGWVSLLILSGAIARRPALALASIFLLPWVQLRVGLALLGLLLLIVWMRRGRLRWSLGAGLAGGVSLFYSQEYGLAFSAVAGVAFLVRRDLRAALVFALGLAAVAAPLLGYFAANDALLPMLRDLSQYPRYMMAGYGKMVFPALASSLPLGLSGLGSEESLHLRLSYAVPAVSLGALLLALPISRLDPRRPFATIREVRETLARDPARLSLVLIALFGLISFRVALGRSSMFRTLAVLPAAVLLLGYGLDRLVDLWGRGSRTRSLALWRTAALALLLLCAGFLEAGRPATLLSRSAQHFSRFLTDGYRLKGDRDVLRVARWIQLNTEAGEPVLFLPDNGAYYYLTDRPNPIRFVMGHQIVSDAHRREVLSSLQSSPPRFVAWDHDAYRVDEIPDELVFGPALLSWIEENYREQTRIGGVAILRRIALAD